MSGPMLPSLKASGIHGSKCGIPQSSRVIVTLAASRDQRARSLCEGEGDCAEIVDASPPQSRRSLLEDLTMDRRDSAAPARGRTPSLWCEVNLANVRRSRVIALHLVTHLQHVLPRATENRFRNCVLAVDVRGETNISWHLQLAHGFEVFTGHNRIFLCAGVALRIHE